MKVNINYFAPFQEITGTETETIELSDPGLPHFISALVKKYPAIEKYIFAEDKKLRQNLAICVNDKFTKDIEKIELKDDDSVSIMFVIGGG